MKQFLNLRNLILNLITTITSKGDFVYKFRGQIQIYMDFYCSSTHSGFTPLYNDSLKNIITLGKYKNV